MTHRLGYFPDQMVIVSYEIRDEPESDPVLVAKYAEILDRKVKDMIATAFFPRSARSLQKWPLSEERCACGGIIVHRAGCRHGGLS